MRPGRTARVTALVLGVAAAAAPALPLPVPTRVCEAPGDQVVSAMADDGQGGALVVWLDSRLGQPTDLWVHRLGPTAALAAQWPSGGVLACRGGTELLAPSVAPDGWGGAWIAWQDVRLTASDIRIQHVDAFGRLLFDAAGQAVCAAPGSQGEPAIAPDGQGGVWVVWADRRSEPLGGDIYAQHLARTGQSASGWPADGRALCAVGGRQRSPSAVADGAGGFVAVWEDERGTTGTDVYAQRLEANGTALWGADGFPVCRAAGEQQRPRLAPDGAGGALFVWEDQRGADFDIFAVGVRAAGWIDWGWSFDGSPVCIERGSQFAPRIVADSRGGALFTWFDRRAITHDDIWIQRLTDHGEIPPGWTAGGVAVCSAPGSQIDPAIATDGAGGAFVGWTDGRDAVSDVYVQRIASPGVRPGCWPIDGAPVLDTPEVRSGALVLANGSGGALVAWTVRPEGPTGDGDVHARWVGPTGDAILVLPPADGAPLCAAGGHQSAPDPLRRSTLAVPDGTGGGYVAWEDLRSGVTDVFVQRLGPDGATASGWPVGGIAVAGAPGERGAPCVAADRAGGLFVVWEDRRAPERGTDLYVQRFAPGGTSAPGWPQDGAAVATASGDQRAPRLAVDESGRAWVVWQDRREHGRAHVYVQVVAPTGLVGSGWPAGGRNVGDPERDRTQPDILCEGWQGALVLWSEQAPTSRRIVAYAMKPDGGVQTNWSLTGLDVCPAGALQSDPVGVPSGAGGAIVSWIDRRSAPAVVYARRMLREGGYDRTWPEAGVRLASRDPSGSVRELQALADGAGGVLCSWTESGASGVVAWLQRLRATGARAEGWPSGASRLCSAASQQLFPALWGDGEGGALAVWMDLRAGAPDIFAQHIGSGGTPVAGWPADGLPVCTNPAVQSSPRIVADPGCPVLVSWHDLRGADEDVYATAFDPVRPVVDLSSPIIATWLRAFPNPFRDEVAFGIPATGANEISIYDAAGRLVRRLGSERSASRRTIVWDGRDARGARVPAAIYFVRLHSAAGDARLKLVRAQR